MRNKIILDPKNAIQLKQYPNGRKFYVFKCANIYCTNTLNVGAAPSQLKKSTGVCTSCHRKKKPYECIYNRLVDRAHGKNVKLNLTYLDFLEFTKIDQCEYCQSSIKWLEHVPSNYRGEMGYNLDKKDASKGYTKENCVVCCKICNWSKNDLFTHEEFLKIGKVIKQILKGRKNGSK